MGEDELRRRIRAAIERFGVRRVARLLGLSAEATLRLGGGFGTQVGTLMVARAHIERLDVLAADTGEPSAA
jgi:hypothetical protein